MIVRVLKIGLLAMLAVSVLLFLIVVLIRVQYPYELEYLEGLSVDQARWILAGHSPYVPPSIEFVPLVYSPIFFYASAAVMELVGVGFSAPRLVSFAATLTTLILLFLTVERDSKNKFAGLVAAGLYGASYQLTGTWMDLARPDSMFLAFLLAGLYVSRRFSSGYGLIVSGVLYALAYHTKQPALPTIILMLLVSPLVFGRKSIFQIGSCVLIGGGTYLVWNYASQGWLGFYTLSRSVRQIDTFGLAKIGWFWNEIVPILLPILIVCFGFLLANTKRFFLMRRRDRLHWLPVVFALGLIATSWNIYLNEGTYSNGLMPACIGFALLGGLAVAWVQKQPGRLYHYGAVIVLSLLIVQTALLYYLPVKVLPSEENREASDKFVSFLESIPGEVLVYDHGYISALAGKNTYMHRAAYIDASGEGSPPSTSGTSLVRQEMVRAALRDAVSDQMFEAIIVDDLHANWLPYYVDRTSKLGLDASYSPVPLVGPSAQPKTVMLKNPLARGGQLTMDQSSATVLLKGGWGEVEDGGRWGIGKRSSMDVPLEPGHSYRLELLVEPYCFGEDVRQELKVHWNSERLARFEFPDCEAQIVQVEVPADLVQETGNEIVFRYKHTSEQGDGTGAGGKLSARFLSIALEPVVEEAVSDSSAKATVNPLEAELAIACGRVCQIQEGGYGASAFQ